jgi:phosphoribosylamine--glycine ligase
VNRVLVVGGGNREHAMVRALCRSAQVGAVASLPAGIRIGREVVRSTGERVAGLPGRSTDPSTVVEAARGFGADLVVIGPAQPCAAGVTDELRRHGFAVCGVGREAARLEASKDVGRRFLQRHGLPTPRAERFDDAAAAIAYARTLPGGCAVKADGFAGGAGVVVCTSVEEAEWTITEMLDPDRPTPGGLVIQERCQGPEFSLHAIVDGHTFVLLDPSQDYKRLFDGDLGPNTGGVGSCSPVPWLPDAEYRGVATDICTAALAGLERDGIDYRGVLYLPVMLTPAGPRILEINVRFGNPEVQSLLARFDDDLFELLYQCATGTLDPAPRRWSSRSAVTVASCVTGYPSAPAAPVRVDRIDVPDGPDTATFWSSGIQRDGTGLVAHTARVLTVTATAATLPQARARAYAAISGIRHAGQYYRLDVGGPGDVPEASGCPPGYGVIVLVGGLPGVAAEVAEAVRQLYPRADPGDASVHSGPNLRASLGAGRLPVVTGIDRAAAELLLRAEFAGEVACAVVCLDRWPRRTVTEMARWVLASAFLPRPRAHS